MKRASPTQIDPLSTEVFLHLYISFPSSFSPTTGRSYFLAMVSWRGRAYSANPEHADNFSIPSFRRLPLYVFLLKYSSTLLPSRTTYIFSAMRIVECLNSHHNDFYTTMGRWGGSFSITKAFPSDSFPWSRSLWSGM